MQIVTSANHAFIHCLVRLVESVHRVYGRPPIVYDVGLADQDRRSVDATIIPVQAAEAAFEYARDGDGKFICATHKPACVAHYWRHYSEPMIFIDADCVFMRRVEQTGFDFGVTVRTRGFDPKDHFNGVVNTGVIFFNSPCEALVKAWADACAQPNTTDQKALVDVLAGGLDWRAFDAVQDWRGLRAKVFRTDEFNDYHFRGGAVYHFKGDRHDPAIYPQLVAALERGEDVYRLYRKLRAPRRKSWLDKLLSRRSTK